MRKGELWTDKEIEYLLKNYKYSNIDKIARTLNRTRAGTIQKYYSLIKESEKSKKKAKTTNCLNCGGSKYNEVTTTVYTDVGDKTIKAYYCIECLHEFTNEEVIPPLWA